MNADQLNRQQIREHLISYLPSDSQTQYRNIEQNAFEKPLGRVLTNHEFQLLFEVIQEFLATGILIPAADKNNVGWPWLSVTTRGMEMLRDSGPKVYDYDSYLADLRSRVDEIDEMVERFVSESLRSYQMHCYLASMTMLGCASERLIRLLIDAFAASIDGERNADKFRSRVNGRDISVAFDAFKKSFDSNRRQVRDQELVRDFDARVEGTFQFIRLVRNSIVHGSDPSIPDALVYGSLQQFSLYAETIFALKRYFKANTITV